MISQHRTTQNAPNCINKYIFIAWSQTVCQRYSQWEQNDHNSPGSPCCGRQTPRYNHLLYLFIGGFFFTTIKGTSLGFNEFPMKFITKSTARESSMAVPIPHAKINTMTADNTDYIFIYPVITRKYHGSSIP